MLAFCFYYACNREGDTPKQQDGFIEKPAVKPPKPKKAKPAAARYLTVFEGRVTAIKDGDTFEVLFDGQPERVRLAEIDCPEKAQPFGNNARNYAADLCFGKTVTVASNGKRDRYGRIVGIITTQDGVNVNEELVKAGLAWHYKQYSKNENIGLMQERAKAQQIGLWQDKNPVAPWNWRKHKRKVKAKKQKEAV